MLRGEQGAWSGGPRVKNCEWSGRTKPADGVGGYCDDVWLMESAAGLLTPSSSLLTRARIGHKSCGCFHPPSR